MIFYTVTFEFESQNYTVLEGDGTLADVCITTKNIFSQAIVILSVMSTDITAKGIDRLMP